jgi:hypothetical protein
MNKGIYYSLARVSIDTPQPDGSVVKTSIQTLGLYIIISFGDNGSQRAASASLIMSLYLSNQVPT